MGLIRTLARAANVAVIVVLHDLNAAAAYCDHIICLAQGRIARAGSVAEVYTDDLLSEIYGWPITVTNDHGLISVHPARRRSTTGEEHFISLIKEN